MSRRPLFDKTLLTVRSSSGELNLVKLAIPIFLELLFNNLIGTVGTTILSGYSEEAVVATGTVNIIFNLFIAVFASLATGVAVVISNLLGAERIKESQNAIYTGIILVGGFGVLCGLSMFLLSSSIATAMNLTGTVFSMAVTYIKLRSLELVFLALSTVLLAELRCFGYSKSTVVVGVIKNVLNTIFSFYAVNLATIPVLSGVSGVGIGFILCQAIAFLISLSVFLHARIKVLPTRSIKNLINLSGKVLKIGIPTCISNASFNLSQIVTNSFAVLMGMDDVAGKIYLANILCFAPLFSGGVGTANALLVGRLYGAKNYDHAERINKMLVCVAVPVNVLVTLSILILRIPLLSIFTDNKAIFAMSLSIILVDFIVEIARGFSHIYEYALRGVRDVNVVMVVTFCSCWIFGVGLSYLTGITLGLGLIGCYIGLAADETVRAFISIYRWRKGSWKRNNTISVTEY